MASPFVYTGGKVTLSRGHTEVVGTGTAFKLAKPGHRIWTPGSGGRDCRIASIEDNEHLTLAWGWPGASQVAGDYEIVIEPDAVAVLETSRQLFDLLSQGSYAQPDDVGTLAQRAAHDTAPKDFIYWQIDVTPFVVFVKKSATSGDWSAGTSIQGPKGDTGTAGQDGIDGTSFAVNAVGTFAERDAHDDEAKDYAYLATDAGPDPDAYPAGSLYIKLSDNDADWSPAVPFGKGEKGDKGDKGDTGDQGLKGDKGDKGDTGDQGPKGDKGDTGAKGDTGDRGLQGNTGAKGDKGDTGNVGPAGSTGWSPTFTLQSDGERAVHQLSGYVGGTGTAPTTDVGKYTGSGGMVADIHSGFDLRGNAGRDGTDGEDGDDGADGDDGWSPVEVGESDGARRLRKIVDWTGGSGTKPVVDVYVGDGELTATKASALDFRGPAGPAGTGTGNMLVDDGVPTVAGEIFVASGADPTAVEGSGTTITEVTGALTDLDARITALPNAKIQAIIFGG